MSFNHYKIRITELRSEGVSTSDIARMIYREYGIRLKTNQITNVSTDTSELNISQLKSSDEILVNTIENILTRSHIPLSSKSLAIRIKSEFDQRVTKSEVNKLIFKHLKDKVYYDRYRFTYSWKGEKVTEKKDNLVDKNEFVENRVKSIVGEFDSVNIMLEIKNYFRDALIEVSTGIEQIDYLIKSVVKDNIITSCEETFLRSKAKEFGYSEDIISVAKKSLESNNPYLDNLIHIIFDDGLITPEELVFLKEKTNENGFSTTFVNERFWMIGLAEYTNHLVKMESLDKVVLLHYVLHKNNPEKFSYDKLLTDLDIYNTQDLSELGKIMCEKLAKELNEELHEKFSLEFDYSNFILKNISIITDESDSTDISTSDSTDSLSKFLKILNQERMRIGSPDVNLLVENINYRIENNLWD